MPIRPFALALAAMLAFATAVHAADSPTETALDRYLAKPEPAYGWNVVKTISGPGYKGWVLDLTSQSWRSEGEVDRTVWHHWLTIVKPDGASTGSGPPCRELQKPNRNHASSAMRCLHVLWIHDRLAQFDEEPMIALFTW